MKNPSKSPFRTRRCQIRLTADEYALLAGRAQDAGINFSDYARRTLLRQKFASTVDELWLHELRRIGGLIKRHYPAVLSWTAEEKKRYWDTRELLLALIDEFAEKIGSKVVKKDRAPKKGEPK